VNVIFILIAVSLLVALGFLGLFLWSIRAGQYDDEYTPSVRILFEDEVNILEDENSKFHPPAGGPNKFQKNKFKNANDH
jgi:cbb3-type cytochrome oxidase maturation protein